MSKSNGTRADFAGPSILKFLDVVSWSSLDDMPYGYVRPLGDMLLTIKVLFFPGCSLELRELHAFLLQVMKYWPYWETGRFISPPTDDTAASLDEISVEFGILAEDAPTVVDTSPWPRPQSPASNSTTITNAYQSIEKHRVQGQPVKLVAQWHQDSGFVFKFCDKQGGWLPDNQSVHYTHLTQDEAHFFAMRSWDRYCVSNSLLRSIISDMTYASTAN